MAKITLHRKPTVGKFYLPLWVSVDGRPIGLMRGGSVAVELPEGNYNVGVSMVFQLWKLRFALGGERVVTASELMPVSLMITDRERLWNILFDIDLVVWLASLFFTLPSPWNIVYHVLSDGFFALWIVRLIIIRKRYFKILDRDNP